MIEGPATVLDVGCGNGQISRAIATESPGLHFFGVDIAKRPSCAIPMMEFDGVTLPFADHSYDWVTFVDVLHHTEDPSVLIKEAARVAGKGVIIKDHLNESPWAEKRLKFMDWVGNRQHGVVLPYNYWSMNQWEEAWKQCGLRVEAVKGDLGLYPWPFSLIFGNGLHFIAKLKTRP